MQSVSIFKRAIALFADDKSAGAVCFHDVAFNSGVSLCQHLDPVFLKSMSI